MVRKRRGEERKGYSRGDAILLYMQNSQTSTLLQSCVCLGEIVIGYLLLMEIKKQNESNQNKPKQNKTLLLQKNL